MKVDGKKKDLRVNDIGLYDEPADIEKQKYEEQKDPRVNNIDLDLYDEPADLENDIENPNHKKQ